MDRKGQPGFTLLELLVVIAIAGILLGIGMPSLREMVLNAARKEASTNLYSALHRARSEAIVRNAVLGVEVCARDLAADNPVCADDHDWSEGWLVGATLADGSFELLAVYGPVSDSLRFETAPTEVVRFDASGRTSAAVDFRLCAAEGAGDSRSRRVQVRRSGGISLEDAPTC